MAYLNFKSLYDKYPHIEIKSYHSDQLYKNQEEILKVFQNIKEGIIIFETYPGIDLTVLLKDIIHPLKADEVICIEEFSHREETIDDMLKHHLTDDRVFGVMSHHTIHDFYPKEIIASINKRLKTQKGLTIVYGFGASLIHGTHLVHVSLTRWEIQLRYRKGLTNFKKHNPKEDILRKYKRGFFIEWRVADRIKESFLAHANYIIDYNDLNQPKMITRELYVASLDHALTRPFRMVPYFDPGVWGGQWMKEVCNLDKHEQNYAWSFDGVPEENSMRFKYGETIFEIPAQDLVDYAPERLMGSRTHARFGKKFPIRFDLLDTMGGGNLSLQVHPLQEYIYDKFGMPYTQDESYYILDTEDDGTVYLGFKENVDKKAFEHDLRKAQRGDAMFPAETYVNIYKAKKHDHFLIPAGTIHCSGKNTLVLEISATAYIFTFKLWDWGRVGLDGKPRPVHLEHGFKALQYDRDTNYVNKELYNAITKVSDTEEITGLHEREFLETRRYHFNDTVDIDTYRSVNMGNLVEGQKAIIESLDGSFEPYEIHYAETFLIPATISKFRVRCLDKSCKIIKAHVR